MSHNNALHNAAKEGNLSEVQILVRNFDINAKGQHGGTALYWAAREGHTEIVKLLLTLNADVNIPDVSIHNDICSSDITLHQHIQHIFIFHPYPFLTNRASCPTLLMFPTESRNDSSHVCRT